MQHNVKARRVDGIWKIYHQLTCQTFDQFVDCDILLHLGCIIEAIGDKITQRHKFRDTTWTFAY